MVCLSESASGLLGGLALNLPDCHLLYAYLCAKPLENLS